MAQGNEDRARMWFLTWSSEHLPAWAEPTPDKSCRVIGNWPIRSRPRRVNPDVEQLARWYRFLPTGDTKEQQKIMDRIADRFKKAGGMTPALSRKIGHDGRY